MPSALPSTVRPRGTVRSAASVRVAPPCQAPRTSANILVASGFRPSRSEEHTSELQSLMRISYAVFCLKKKTKNKQPKQPTINKEHTITDKSKNLTVEQIAQKYYH